MRYRVTYHLRSASEDASPADLLPVPPGVVEDAKLVQEIEPVAPPRDDVIDPEDDFDSFGMQIWEYKIAPGREGEFEYAVQTMDVAIDMVEVEDPIQTTIN